MKKTSRLIFAIIVFFLLFVGLAPRFLFLEGAQKAITEQLRKSLNSEVTVEKMEWSWLPLPHLSLVNANIINEYSEISLPNINIFPDWRLIFKKTFIPGRIHLENPDIFINQKVFHTGKPSGSAMPGLSVSIKNAKLKVQSPDDYRDVLLEDHLLFNNINGSLKLGPRQAKVDLKGSSPFSRRIDLQGFINISDKKFKLLLDCEDIKLHQSVKAFFKGRLIPAESTARLTATLAGTGLHDIEARLHGVLPSFRVKPDANEILLSNAFADLTLLKSGPLLRITVKDLEMQDPQARLSGMVERRLSAASNVENLQGTVPDPTWTLDLKGTDLDVTSIRKKVLTLWSDNKVAKTVCNVVRDGKAVSGAYQFSGRTADFKNLDTMIIEAEALDADIHVPGAELDITRASGPIMIKNSVLTGNNLSAQMGESSGSNGKLFLDLSKRSRAFTLDLDIDADLAALPPVLEQLVHHGGFQRELRKFKDVTGRGSANVKLGDSLDNIIARVDVTDMRFSTGYDQLPHTVFIEKGALQVDREEVSWQKVKGRTGLQQIMSTSGSVSWHTGDILLNIEEMQGQLDGESLYAMLQQTGVMPEKIKGALSSLHGNFDLSQGSLHGPANQPEAWEYQLLLKTKGFSFASPLLPEPVTLKELSAALSDNKATIQQAEIRFMDQPLSLKGALNHQLLENWQGTLEFNGPVQPKLADWLDSKGWLPEKLHPRIPCIVENLAVKFQGETTAVTGKILPGLSGKRLPMARIDLENTPERLRINKLTFYAPGEQGSLSLDYRHQAPYGLALSWEGFVTADTIDTLFRSSAFTSGSFSGAFFEISYLAGQPEATRFKGLLKAENLLLKESGKEDPVVIKNIVMNGIDKQLRIITLDIGVGTESITGMGQLAADEKGMQIDIDLASSHLSKNSLDKLKLAIQERQDIFLNGHKDQNDAGLTQKSWEFTGHIGFAFDSYSFNRTTSTPYNEERFVTYTLYDVQGDMQLAPENLSRTEIFSSKLCGLDFRGFWHSDANSPQNLQLNTNPDGSFRLENVLPCLGVQQDLIEGEFTLQANLQKKSGYWNDGNIYIKSTQGRILRLKTLSRIFAIVNITDLLEQHVESAGKKGFPYTQMDIDTHIEANNLIFDRAIIRGEGLNLFARGEVHLDDYDTDLTLLIAPLKSFDAMVSKVPFIGQQVMDSYESVVTIPVAIKGPIADPVITPLHPSAVGGAILNLVKDTLMMPFTILKQDGKSETEQDVTPDTDK